MDITLYNHQYALLGSLATVLTLLFMAKNKMDQANKPFKIRQFISKQWDDFLYLVIIAQILVLVQEYIVGAYVDYKDIEEAWDTYYNNEELISFCVGLFGNLLFVKIFKLGRQKIDSENL